MQRCSPNEFALQHHTQNRSLRSLGRAATGAPFSSTLEAMKTSLKWTLLGISHAAAFVVGGALFHYFAVADQIVANIQESQEILALSQSDVLLTELEKNGTASAYQDELLRKGNLLEQYRGKNGIIINDRVIDTDKMLIFIRLAAIEAKAGRAEGEAQFMAKAIELCPKAGFKECSASQLKEIGEQITNRFKAK